MDLGCYPVHWLRTFMQAEPVVESATSVLGPLGADESIEARLTFGETIADLRASMAPGVPFAAPFHARGELGSGSVDNLVLPHRGHSVTVVLDGVSSTHTVGGVETYDYQLDAVVGAVTTGQAAATEGAAYIANMAVIDAIYPRH
jgi:predicted dehydrogenase